MEVILAGQSASGAYVACPNFEVYRYSWLRDGCFIADAMREVGEVESADRFFDWCAHVVHARPTGPWDARYTLDGERDTSSVAEAADRRPRPSPLGATAARDNPLG